MSLSPPYRPTFEASPPSPNHLISTRLTFEVFGPNSQDAPTATFTTPPSPKPSTQPTSLCCPSQSTTSADSVTSHTDSSSTQRTRTLPRYPNHHPPHLPTRIFLTPTPTAPTTTYSDTHPAYSHKPTANGLPSVHTAPNDSAKPTTPPHPSNGPYNASPSTSATASPPTYCAHARPASQPPPPPQSHHTPSAPLSTRPYTNPHLYLVHHATCQPTP